MPVTPLQVGVILLTVDGELRSEHGLAEGAFHGVVTRVLLEAGEYLFFSEGLLAFATGLLQVEEE